MSTRATVDPYGTNSTSGEHAPTLALTIVYHPQLDRVGERASLEGFSVDKPIAISRIEPLFGVEPLGDEAISRTPIHLVAMSDGGVRIDIGKSTIAVSLHGERVVGSVVVPAKDLVRGVVLGVGSRVLLLLHRTSVLENMAGAGAGAGPGESGAERELVGESDAIRRVLWDIHNVADLDLPVLLRGETGSGKELVARALHRSSARRDKPFVAVNLGAITASLAVAELFGAEKGAFTGSLKRQVGYFEQAAGGTLFLDEIGEAPVELQVALLRALETGEIQTVGSAQPRKIDVRVVAATDADLENKVANGSFRAPLLNRLAAYEISIPPLRERRDDIGRLFVRFLREELEAIGEAQRLVLSGAEAKPWVAASLVARLVDYDWPGNVRQLRNVVRQLVIGNRGRNRAEIPSGIERLLAAQSPKATPAPSIATASKQEPVPPNEAIADRPPRSVPPRRPADVTEGELREALRLCRWDLNESAEKLGIARSSMYNFDDRFPWFRVAGDLTEQEIRQCFKDCGGDIAQMVERLEVSEKALRRRLREFDLI